MSNTTSVERLEEPPVARWAFSDTGFAPIIWLVLRLYLGYEWLVAGWDKVTSDAWMSGGAALQGFAAGALESGTQGDHPAIAYGWYVNFLEWIRDTAHPVLGPLVAVGELLIGLALLIGLFTGIAAFLGSILNFSFVFAGSAGVNPAMLLVAGAVILAWRNAGWFGLDRYVLPALGTPWSPGPLLHARSPDDTSGTASSHRKERQPA
jgi:thiosulfate dehydrogenase [quinone] large subunit